MIGDHTVDTATTTATAIVFRAGHSIFIGNINALVTDFLDSTKLIKGTILMVAAFDISIIVLIMPMILMRYLA